MGLSIALLMLISFVDTTIVYWRGDHHRFDYYRIAGDGVVLVCAVALHDWPGGLTFLSWLSVGATMPPTLLYLRRQMQA
ncbi:MAG: hypothetical protein ACRDK3_02700 [Actinomycetota bacterium]